MKIYLYTLFILLIAIGYKASAQVGIKTSLLSPRGDLAKVFKKGMAYEVFFVAEANDRALRVKAGFLYSRLSPALDTFPIYMVKDNSIVLPGFETYGNMEIKLIYIENSFRLFHVKNLAFFAGVGIVFGFASAPYAREIETVIIESGSINEKIGGLRFTAEAVYTVGKHVQVFAEAMHCPVVVTDWSSSYTHRMYGIGVNYVFNKIDE